MFFDLTHFRGQGKNPSEYFVCFLRDLKPNKNAFEINWPLVQYCLEKYYLLMNIKYQGLKLNYSSVLALVEPSWAKKIESS